MTLHTLIYIWGISTRPYNSLPPTVRLTTNLNRLALPTAARMQREAQVGEIWSQCHTYHSTFHYQVDLSVRCLNVGCRFYQSFHLANALTTTLPKYSTECNFLTCLNSFSTADMTIRPLHTTGAVSSTKNPTDILQQEPKNRTRLYKLTVLFRKYKILKNTHQAIP